MEWCAHRQGDCLLALFLGQRDGAFDRSLVAGNNHLTGRIVIGNGADFTLRRFSRDLGSLMQLLDAMDRYALQTQRALTIPLVKSMLENA